MKSMFESSSSSTHNAAIRQNAANPNPNPESQAFCNNAAEGLQIATSRLNGSPFPHLSSPGYKFHLEHHLLDKQASEFLLFGLIGPGPPAHTLQTTASLLLAVLTLPACECGMSRGCRQYVCRRVVAWQSGWLPAPADWRFTPGGVVLVLSRPRLLPLRPRLPVPVPLLLLRA